MKPIKNPFSRADDPINHDIYERFMVAFDPHALAIQIYEDVKNKIEVSVNEMTPELLASFNTLYKESTSLLKSCEKSVYDMEKNAKKLFESSSLTEDVFKLRDEMKNIKKKLDRLNNGLKAFSRLPSLMEED